jgi:hypothetical protein
MNLHLGHGYLQGGIIFWLCANLGDVPNILPEMTLMKNDDNDQICIKIYLTKK